MLNVVLQISRGLIRDQTARRQLMFYGVLVALVMLFLGATLLFPWLRTHPLLFIGYWGVCAWITMLATLLAVFDLLLVRGSARRARRTLEKEYLERRRKELTDDSQPPGA